VFFFFALFHFSPASPSLHTPKQKTRALTPQASAKPDYAAVREAIASRMDVDDYDDGSYGA
jgi:hypothetical protein